MVQPSDMFADALLTHHLDLQRLTAGEQAKALGVLREMQGDLTSRLMIPQSTYSRNRVNALLKETDKTIRDYYGRIESGVDLNDIGQYEAQWTGQRFAGMGLNASIPSAALMRSVVSNTLVFGAPSRLWWDKQASDMAFKFSAQIRQGISEGETMGQIVNRIVGGAGRAGIMEETRRGAYALVHTSVTTVLNDARSATYHENDEVVAGEQFLATLDSRTTLICIAHSGDEWDMAGNPINGTVHPYEVPPLHWSCRSTLVPILKTWRELGIDINEMAPGQRASELGPINADTTFDQFLKMHPAGYADEVLGPGRADLWRKGKISLSDLVSGRGRELSLKELKKKAA